MTSTMQRRALTVPETADLLGVGTTKAWSLVYSGELRAIRIGRSVRVPVEEVDRFVCDRLPAAKPAA